MKEITEKIVYVLRKLMIAYAVNRGSGRKGLVLNDLGADMSLPPCLIGSRHRVGGRLVSDSVAHS